MRFIHICGCCLLPDELLKQIWLHISDKKIDSNTVNRPQMHGWRVGTVSLGSKGTLIRLILTPHVGDMLGYVWYKNLFWNTTTGVPPNVHSQLLGHSRAYFRHVWTRSSGADAWIRVKIGGHVGDLVRYACVKFLRSSSHPSRDRGPVTCANAGFCPVQVGGFGCLVPLLLYRLSDLDKIWCGRRGSKARYPLKVSSI